MSHRRPRGPSMHRGSRTAPPAKPVGSRQRAPEAESERAADHAGAVGTPKEAWAWALGLALPMALTYGVHFAAAPAGSTPTGFLQFDQFYYSANAREHFDSGH